MEQSGQGGIPTLHRSLLPLQGLKSDVCDINSSAMSGEEVTRFSPENTGVFDKARRQTTLLCDARTDAETAEPGCP
jgi:hypothetical protein